MLSTNDELKKVKIIYSQEIPIVSIQLHMTHILIVWRRAVITSVHRVTHKQAVYE